MLEPISLETAVTDDLCLGDYIEDKSCNSPENTVISIFLKSDIQNIFSELSQREKDIMIQSVEKDTKYRFDNLKRKCKLLVIENVVVLSFSTSLATPSSPDTVRVQLVIAAPD